MAEQLLSTPAKATPVQRYGPVSVMVVVVALLAAFVTVVARSQDRTPTTGRTAPGGGGDRPVTYAQAKAGGRERTITWADNCDPGTGRIKLPTVYAPPCVPRFTGDNGGETAPGVRADRITAVVYLPPVNGDVLASLAGAVDSVEDSRETMSRFVELLNATMTTYGRKVELVFYDGRAAASDAVAARAEAQDVIDRFQPFASINGPALTTAYAEELAAQGVLCIACTRTASDRVKQDNAPHLWGISASPEQWITIVSEYVGKRLAGRPARWAGDPALRAGPRTFGIVNLEQDPPQFTALSATGDNCESVVGWHSTVHETYLSAEMQARAPTIVAKLKAEHVTTVLFMGDPIMPIVLTAEATRQGYHPEWVLTGTAFTDTAVFGRRYDPDQWAHAFGLSQLGVSIPQEQVDGWSLHQWYFGTPPKAQKTGAGTLWPPLFLLFNGIHLAGPALTVDTFRQGLFDLPVAGGGPTAPRISYGDRGTFPALDPDSCRAGRTIVDYDGPDDMVELWWDRTVRGPDEQGTDGAGRYRYVEGGRRYLAGQLPTTEPDVFSAAGSVTELTTRPDADRAPGYPPPRR
jgi:hypothetical protein